VNENRCLYLILCFHASRMSSAISKVNVVLLAYGISFLSEDANIY